MDALLLRTVSGANVMDACGCDAASTGATCTADDHCASYGVGNCQNNLSGIGYCSAECYDFQGNPPAPVVPDPTCGHNGNCLYLSELDGTPEMDPQCVTNCTSATDCAEGYCYPLLNLPDVGSHGICDNGFWATDVQTCDTSADCADSGGGCVGGLCYAPCSSDNDCSNEWSCDQTAGHCDPNFQ